MNSIYIVNGTSVGFDSVSQFDIVCVRGMPWDVCDIVDDLDTAKDTANRFIESAKQEAKNYNLEHPETFFDFTHSAYIHEVQIDNNVLRYCGPVEAISI